MTNQVVRYTQLLEQIPLRTTDVIYFYDAQTDDVSHFGLLFDRSWLNDHQFCWPFPERRRLPPEEWLILFPCASPCRSMTLRSYRECLWVPLMEELAYHEHVAVFKWIPELNSRERARLDVWLPQLPCTMTNQHIVDHFVMFVFGVEPRRKTLDEFLKEHLLLVAERPLRPNRSCLLTWCRKCIDKAIVGTSTPLLARGTT